MPMKIYEVRLTESERKQLIKTVKQGKSPAKTILRANILLSLDENSNSKSTLGQIAEMFHTTTTTVQNVKKSYCGQGLEKALCRKKRETPPVAPKITGDIEAKIIALSCSDPPEGQSRWTLRLLAEKSVELEIIADISYVSVGNILKKTN